MDWITRFCAVVEALNRESTGQQTGSINCNQDLAFKSEGKHKNLKPSVTKACYKYCPLKSQMSFFLRASKDTGHHAATKIRLF